MTSLNFASLYTYVIHIRVNGRLINDTGYLMLSGDVPPHDEEDGSADEAELNGAGEEEGCAVLH